MKSIAAVLPLIDESAWAADAVGHPADMVVLDCETAAAPVQELVARLIGFKRGRLTFTRDSAVLPRP